MQGTRVRETRSRVFSTLYKRRLRRVSYIVWFLDNGLKKHSLQLTDIQGRVIIKQWSWMGSSTNQHELEESG